MRKIFQKNNFTFGMSILFIALILICAIHYFPLEHHYIDSGDLAAEHSSGTKLHVWQSFVAEPEGTDKEYYIIYSCKKDDPRQILLSKTQVSPGVYFVTKDDKGNKRLTPTKDKT